LYVEDCPSRVEGFTLAVRKCEGDDINAKGSHVAFVGNESKRARGQEGKRARGQEGKRARGQEGKRARGQEGKRAREQEGKRAREQEGKRARAGLLSSFQLSQQSWNRARIECYPQQSASLNIYLQQY
jgi:hypothetical protein